jgi:hypothetical protein
VFYWQDLFPRAFRACAFDMYVFHPTSIDADSRPTSVGASGWTGAPLTDMVGTLQGHGQGVESEVGVKVMVVVAVFDSLTSVAALVAGGAGR